MISDGTLIGPRLPASDLDRAQLACLGGSAPDLVEGWQLVDATGAARLDVWVTGVDCGGVLRAGTAELVGLIEQAGFACNDLAAWRLLASAPIPDASHLAEMDLTIPLDTTLELCAIAAATVAALRLDPASPLAVARVSLDASWRALALIVAPYDDATGSLDAFLHGVTSDRLPGVTFDYGPPGYFDAERVRTLDALLATVPNAAVTAAALALASLEDADVWTTEACVLRLDRLRKFVAAARAANASLLTAAR